MKLRVILTKKMFAVGAVAILLTALAATITFWVVFSGQVKEDLKHYGDTIALHEEAGSTWLKRYDDSTYQIDLLNQKDTRLYSNNQNKKVLKSYQVYIEELKQNPQEKGMVLHQESFMSKGKYDYVRQLEDGAILCVSKEADSVFFLFFKCIPIIIMISLYVLLTCLIMSANFTKGILSPIENIKLSNKDEVYEELKPFVHTIESQAREIRNQVDRIREQKDKISAIIANMEEGLILLDSDKNVLMKNDSAKVLLNLPTEKVIGKNIYEISSNQELLDSVSKAANGESNLFEMQIEDKVVELLVNPVESGGEQTGIICLVVNITDREKTEKMRREFTANVSHELKTPLTSISGYAEMIENGMVKDNGIKRFAGKIHKEAGRLVALISDIINLSKLEDSNAVVPEKQKVNLLDIAEECVETLEMVAEKNQIDIHVLGEPCYVKANSTQLYELIYNLCDNAIRYNNPHGKVEVRVNKQDDKVVLAVEDTGVGIDEEHAARVFERFFRVDKSRSKETGGTGLGLAIVKHVAEQYNAEIVMESKKGVGTTIKVVFDV